MPISAIGTSTTEPDTRPNAVHAVNRTRLQGRPRPAGSRGFTLIELMVVVLIICAVIVGAIISLGATGKDSQLERERDRLAAIMAYVRERGSMLTLEYGLRCGQHGYRFVFYDNRSMQWTPETVDDTLRPRRLPAGVHLELIIEGHPIVLDDKALKIRSSAASAPAASASSPAGNVGSPTGNIASLAGNIASSSGGAAPPGAGTSPLGNMPSSFDYQVANDTPQIMLFSNGDTNSFALSIVRDGVNRSATLQSTDDGTIKVSDIIEPQP